MAKSSTWPVCETSGRSSSVQTGLNAANRDALSRRVPSNQSTFQTTCDFLNSTTEVPPTAWPLDSKRCQTYGSPISLRDMLYATRFQKSRKCRSRFSERRLGDRRGGSCIVNKKTNNSLAVRFESGLSAKGLDQELSRTIKDARLKRVCGSNGALFCCPLSMRVPLSSIDRLAPDSEHRLEATSAYAAWLADGQVP